MELFCIYKYKFSILKHRLNQLKLKDKLTLLFVAMLIVPLVFFINIAILNYFKVSYKNYLIFYNGLNIMLIVLMLPYLIRKAYSSNFDMNKDYILYTVPINFRTIFFYKFIIVNSRFLIPFAIVSIPNFISYGIVNNYSIRYYLLGIISLIMTLIIVSSIIQTIILAIAKLVKEKYRKTIINIIASTINILIIVALLSFGKISNIKNIVYFFESTEIINTIFFYVKYWNSILINLNTSESIMVLGSCLFISTVLIVSVFFALYKFMYLRGCFISDGSSSIVHLYSNENVVYYILKKVFSNNYELIYKDLLIFIRSIEKWGLILMPMVFVTLPFLNRDNWYEYESITQILILLFLWIGSNISFDSIKSEGAMLSRIKNSSFNMKNIIYAKVFYSCLVSVILCFAITIILEILFKFSWFNMFILFFRSISIIFMTSVICCSLGLLYAEQDGESKVKISVKGELLSYFFMIIINGLIFISTEFILHSNLFINSKSLVSLIGTFVIIFIITFVIIFTKMFIKIINNKVIF